MLKFSFAIWWAVDESVYEGPNLQAEAATVAWVEGFAQV